ncbi:MAG: response regulator [Nitrospirae bacterium]|nr:response regulator [Nitrospirota bacterium]
MEQITANPPATSVAPLPEAGAGRFTRAEQRIRKGLWIYLVIRWVIAGTLSLIPIIIVPFGLSMGNGFLVAAFACITLSNVLVHWQFRRLIQTPKLLLLSFIFDSVLAEIVIHVGGGDAYGLRYFGLIVVLFATTLLPPRFSLVSVGSFLLSHVALETLEFLGGLPPGQGMNASAFTPLERLFYGIVPDAFIVWAVWWGVAMVTDQLTREIRSGEERADELDVLVRSATERIEQTQKALIQSEKLSALGQVISGVTHELNNPLTGVIGYAQLLKESASSPDQRAILDKLLREAERSKRIVNNLLVHTRHYQSEKVPIDLNAFVREVRELREYQAGLQNIRFECELDPNLPKTMGEPDHLRQALINIVLNAEQALQDRLESGRKIRISSQVEPPSLPGANGFAHGRIRIAIWNNGPAIPPNVLSRLFEPFFTTKPPGKGTGLGLYLVHNILVDHGGSIRVESDPSRGTTFTLDLPVIPSPAPVAATIPVPPHVETPAPKPPKLVLVVDDEDFILDLLSQALKSDGHRVLTARDGVEALDVLKTAEPGVILMDFRMPRMDGESLVGEIERCYPALMNRMVIMSGSSGLGGLDRLLREKPHLRHIQKPFDLRAVKALIGSM